MPDPKLTRNREICELRKSGLTFVEIGRIYGLPRQVIALVVFWNSDPAIDRSWSRPLRQHFHIRMKGWLWAAGYRKCSSCKMWLTSVVSSRRNVCGACESNNQKARYSQPEGKKKAIARATLNNHIYDGKIIRQPCEVCGSVKTDGHHEDYSKPLDVHWLCRKHHAARHCELKATTEAPQSVISTTQ